MSHLNKEKSGMVVTSFGDFYHKGEGFLFLLEGKGKPETYVFIPRGTNNQDIFQKAKRITLKQAETKSGAKFNGVLSAVSNGGRVARDQVDAIKSFMQEKELIEEEPTTPINDLSSFGARAVTSKYEN